MRKDHDLTVQYSERVTAILKAQPLNPLSPLGFHPLRAADAPQASAVSTIAEEKAEV
jgi:hypothetical protein